MKVPFIAQARETINDFMSPWHGFSQARKAVMEIYVLSVNRSDQGHPDSTTARYRARTSIVSRSSPLQIVQEPAPPCHRSIRVPVHR